MMTREESVLILKNMLRGEVMPVYLTEQKRAAVRIALSALRPVIREKMERYGDTRVVSVTGEMPEQMRMEGMISG